MDLATATYICFFPIFIWLFSPFVPAKILYRIITGFTILALIVTSILGLFDVGLYADWGTRLSTQLLPMLQNPKGMLACVTTLQLVGIILVEAGIVTGSVFLYRFLFKPYQNLEKTKWWGIFVLLFYAAILIIPMRGGIQLTPINLSRTYFSSKLYANHVAVNPYWSFVHRWIYSGNHVKEVTFMESHLCEEMMNKLMNREEKEIPVFIKSDTGKPINVILIILESFSNKAIKSLGGAEELTPNFNKLVQKGILFRNFYACGNRSDKGIAALLASYPALVGAYSILYFPEKMKNLDYLSKYFSHHNYQTHFYYAGETEFYNTKSLIMKSEYNHLVSMYDFPTSERQQKWGVPDAFFYKRIANDLHHFSTPFFLVTYNISSHPPYDIPNIAQRDYVHAVSYSDKWLGDFVAQLKQMPFWENTLLIITADHGTLDCGGTSLANPLSHQIPMLWLGGVVDTVFVNENIGMQTDLSATLVQQLGWTKNPNIFSKNLFGNKGYAFYFNTNGYGFISKDLGFHNDLEIKNIEFFYEQNELKKDSLLKFSEAFVQYLHENFKKR
jgi:phosphoglycerol transferase MdoB-like AlkP superfamily enzyme